MIAELPLPDAPPQPTKARREIETCILEAAPKPGQQCISRRKLAALAGYQYTKHFLDAVRQLVARGELIDIDGRVGLPG